MRIAMLTLAVLISMAGAGIPGSSAHDTTSQDDKMSPSWVLVAGWVERIEGDRITVRRPDGRAVSVDVGSLTLDATQVLRPGRDVVMYGPRQGDGSVMARGLALDYGEAASPAASPRMR